MVSLSDIPIHRSLRNVSQILKPYQTGWFQSITNFESHFEPIPLTHRHSKALKGSVDIDVVVIAERAATVQVHNEGHDVVTELPEVQRALSSLVLFKDFFDITTGYRKIVSTPGHAPSDAAKGYFYGQASLNEAIHDGRHPPNPPFAPPIQIFHPVFNLFVHLVDDPSVQPTNKDLKLTQEFMHLLSVIDRSELKRNAEMRTKLTEILGLDVHAKPKADKSSADGVHMFIADRMRLPLL